MIKGLKNLCEESRSNSCIEHATGIMEELKAPENLSTKMSNISLTGGDKKVLIILSWHMKLAILDFSVLWFEPSEHGWKEGGMKLQKHKMMFRVYDYSL